MRTRVQIQKRSIGQKTPARFQRGEPVALPEIEVTGGPILDISDDPELLSADAADDESWYEPTPEL